MMIEYLYDRKDKHMPEMLVKSKEGIPKVEDQDTYDKLIVIDYIYTRIYNIIDLVLAYLFYLSVPVGVVFIIYLIKP